MPHSISSTDQQWLAHALALARRGEALTSPNPMVGAVLVRNQRVIGEGFHAYEKAAHAEIVALEAAGPAARRSTLYVNLEPCCTTGRTGPCTRALIEAGVARVVAAMRDPNPAVFGRGFKQLRAAGIEVETGGFSQEAKCLNEAFAMWITARRPFITLKSAMTLDGHLVIGPSRGNSDRWITSEASRAQVQQMRHASDAILTGIGTVMEDDPLLTDRTGLPRRRNLLRVIVDSRLRLSPRSQIVRTARNDVLVFTCAPQSGRRVGAMRRPGVEVISVCERAGRPDLQAVAAELGRREITSVLLEAGPTLNEAALEANLVDKIRFFYAPKLGGGPRIANAQTRTRKADRQARVAARIHELANIRIQQFTPDFAVEGYLHDVYGNR